MPTNLGDLTLGVKIDNSALRRLRSELSGLAAMADRIDVGISASSATNISKLNPEITKLNSGVQQLTQQSKQLELSLEKVNSSSLRAAQGSSELSKTTQRAGSQLLNTAQSASRLDSQLEKTARTAQLIQGPLGGIAARLVTLRSVIRENGLAIAGFIAASAGISLVLGKATQSFLKSEASLVKLENTILSTGRAFQIASKEADIFAQNLARDTLLGLEEARDGIAQALTFDNIPTTEIERFGKIAADVAAGLNKDFKGTVTSIAKALQAPASALDGLGRAGIFFSKSQRELLQSLVDTGRQAESSGIILGTLEKRFQGIASARGASAAVDTLAVELALFRESIFKTSGAGDALAQFINALNTTINSFSGEASLATKLGQGFAKILNALTIAVQFLSENMDTLGKVTKFLVTLFFTGGVLKTIGAISKGFISIGASAIQAAAGMAAATTAASALKIGLRAIPFVGIAATVAALITETGLLDFAMEGLFKTAEKPNLEQVNKELKDLKNNFDALGEGTARTLLRLVPAFAEMEVSTRAMVDRLEMSGQGEEAKALILALGKEFDRLSNKSIAFAAEFGVSIKRATSAVNIADSIDIEEFQSKTQKLLKEIIPLQRELRVLEPLPDAVAGERVEKLRLKIASLVAELDKIQDQPVISLTQSLQNLSEKSGIEQLTEGINKTQEALDRFKTGGAAEGNIISPQAREGLEQLNTELKDSLKLAQEAKKQQEDLDLFNSLQQFNKDAPLEKLNESLEQARQQLAGLQSGKVIIIDKDQQEAIAATEKQIKGIIAQQKALDPATDVLAEQNRLIDKFTQGTEFQLANKLATELSEIEALLQQENLSIPVTISLEESKQKLQQEAFALANPLKAGIFEATNSIAPDISNHLTSKLFGEETDFSEISKNYVKKILSGVLQSLLTEPLTKDINAAFARLSDSNGSTNGPVSALTASGGEASSGGGAFESLLGLFGGFQGFFADGGNVVGNKAAIVGERGPELFVPRSAGSIIPNGQTSQMMSQSDNRQVYINVQAQDVESFQSARGRIKSLEELNLRNS